MIRHTTCMTGPFYFISIQASLPETRQHSLFTRSTQCRDDTLTAAARSAGCSVSLRDRDNAIIELLSKAMTCGGCFKRFNEALEGVCGVYKYRVDLETKTATIKANSDISALALIAVVKEHAGEDAHFKDAVDQSVSNLAGISPVIVKFEHIVEVMTCGGCVKRVTEVIQDVPCVTSAKVDLVSKTATIITNSDV